MQEAFLRTSYRTDCYHCRVVADQVITAVPFQAGVVCANCGATRVFIPKIEDVTAKGSYQKPECYPVWHLTPEGSCRHCGVTGMHEVVIGCRNFTVRCENCGFTHFYRFDLEYMDTPPGEGGAGKKEV